MNLARIQIGVNEVAIPRKKAKKEEFQGTMLNMLPGNPFPQICVVSVVSCTKATL